MGQRIALFEEGVEGQGGELLQAGGVVRGHVLGSWEVSSGVVVPVQALVVTGHLTEVGRWPRFGDGTFGCSGHSGRVVAEIFQGGIADRVAVRHHVQLGKHARLLKVTVGDVAGRVGGRDEAGLDVGREGVSPVVALPSVVEVDAAHAGPGRVSGPQQRGPLGHQLREMGRPGAEAGCQAAKGVKAGADK